MSKYKISGRTILNEEGVFVGKIVGDRPHVNDFAKGAKCNFAIIWNEDKRRENLPFYSYFKDVVNYIKSLND